MPRPKLDIVSIAKAALDHARALLPSWLPGGKWDGIEWRCGDLAGNPGKSCAVNSESGRWSDFASNESGGDLVSLYAAIHGVSQIEAARDVATLIGFPLADGHAAPALGARRPAPDEPPPAKPGGKAPRSEWRPIVPVPDNAGPAPRAHVVRGPPEWSWPYSDEAGRLLGVVYRFKTSDGGKEVLPCTYCERPGGQREWRWMQFPEPRPLYLPARAPLRTSLPVLVVEGEKCADAAWEQLGQWYDVVSWPGGGKAAHKAAWSMLRRRRAVLWPDADAKVDKHTGEILPAEKQPGVATMRKIAGELLALEATVFLVDVPAPGEKPDGWDIADAISEGMRSEELRAWIQARLRRFDETADPPVGSTRPPPSPPAGSNGLDDDWQSRLIVDRRDRPVDCRENVMLVLVYHPRWRGAVGFNEFAGRTESLTRTPWGTGPGEWTTRDDRELGLWLAQQVDLLIRSEANLSAGVEMAAERARFHPVLAYLESLQWDRVDRLPHWLQDCCGVEDSNYVRLVGTYFLRSMVARVRKPGAQVDHMLVLEGGQGKGKSSALRVLGGPWYSDTQFRLGDKDALLQLADVWIYEVSELDAFSRADVTAVKQFLTTLNDNIRGVYERRVRKRPRQVVLAGTTNQERYLRDMTGNRRFWPVQVCEAVDLDRLREWRDQLFAQAYAEVKAGERWWPTRDEERELFVPAQDARVIADPWLDELPRRLEEAKWADSRAFTTAELLGALGVSADKIDSAGQMAKRIEAIMHRLGWRRTRERRKDGTRPHVYERPVRTQDGEHDSAIEVPI
ncbi:MAG: hypothetical protein GC151_13250 [Betaproteobacteria bacterium]|nr:hypothetical protein [Betaproteobacteria bacterium]